MADEHGGLSMRGQGESAGRMFYAIDVESRIRTDHPLRPIKSRVDAELRRMSPLFDQAYGRTGRPGIAPERLLKAMLLQALYSVRSERQLVERIETDLLFRWFLDMDPAEDAFDHSAFSHNRQRLSEHGLIAAFFDGVVRQAMEAGLCSDDHFSVDGTLIRSHGSLKSLQPIKAQAADDDDRHDGTPPREGGRNPEVNFHGQRRSNATHRSSTDPEARLFRKGNGQPAYLCHSGHLMTENRHGLIVALAVDEANSRSEREQALAKLDEIYEKRGTVPTTLAADKGYASGEFLSELVGRVVRPQVAMPEVPIRGDTDEHDRRRTMRRRMRTVSYGVSQRRRKLIEEAFGWLKTVAGLARTRLVGRWKLKLQFAMSAAAYNLVRMNRLAAA
jgi:transposase